MTAALLRARVMRGSVVTFVIAWFALRPGTWRLLRLAVQLLWYAAQGALIVLRPASCVSMRGGGLGQLDRSEHGVAVGGE
jgi:hypothetical protein